MTPRTLLLIVLAVLLVAAPASAQVTEEDLAEARRELQRVSAELDAMTARYEEALAKEAQLTDQLDQLRAGLAQTELELAETRELIRRRVAEMYIEGGSPTLTVVLDSGSIGEVSAKLGYLEEVGISDHALVRRLQVARRQYDEAQARVSAATEEQAAAVAELEAVSSELTAALEEADAEFRALVEQKRREDEQRRREEEARRRAAEEAARRAAAAAAATSTTAATDTPAQSATQTTPPTTSAPPADPSPPPVDGGGMYCPVAGFSSFVDTWGAPRSGGRRHQGVDMMAARGTPVVAVEGGSVRLSNSRLGGISVWMRTGGGTVYFYTHLDGWAAGLSSGQQVSAGQLIGYVGSTGNASASAPHLHFEYHPNGVPVNPYPLAVSLCR